MLVTVLAPAAAAADDADVVGAHAPVAAVAASARVLVTAVSALAPAAAAVSDDVGLY